MGECDLATVLRNSDFVWRGLELHLGRRKILTLVADEACPHLYRVTYPSGWASSAANITRARDASYGHARYLLTQETPAEGVHSPETGKEAA
jgi:hypothetical protein